MRLLFFGAGEFGLPTLQALHAAHEIAAVVTQPDRPAGRGQRPRPTPIAQWAEQQGLPVWKTDDANDPAFVAKVAAAAPDASVVIAFGQKLSPQLVEASGELMMNLHASLLPKYRGAAPINWAVIEGEAVTGNTVIGIAQRMDAGLIYGQQETPIAPHETAGELHDRLAGMGPDLVMEVLAKFKAGTLEGREQDDTLATQAPKLSRADGVVDFTQSAQRVRQRIHGLTPWPGITVRWTPAGGGDTRPLKLLRVAVDKEGERATADPGTILPDHRVATGDGVIRLLEVQAPGSKAMDIESFARGHRFDPGGRLD